MQSRFLPSLLRQAGLRVDTRAGLNIEAWLDAAHERGWLMSDPECARAPIRAILCKSAREQAAFDTVFDDWLESWDRAGLVLAPSETQQAAIRSPESASTLEQHRTQFKKPLFGALTTLVVVGGALVNWQQWAPTPDTPDKPEVVQPQASAPSASAPAPFKLDLEVQLPDARPKNIQPAPPPTAPASASSDSPRGPFGLHPGAYAILVLIAATVGLGIRRERQFFIQRVTTREKLREQEVFARTLLPVTGARREGLRRAARFLRKPEPSERRQLDLQASVKASAAHAGMFMAVLRQRFVTPEYLFLIDRVGQGDQQAHWAIQMAQDLAAEGVILSLYEYSRDPRWVAPLRTQRSAKAHGPPAYLPLSTLVASHGGQGLVLMGDGLGLIDDVRGQLQAWLMPSLSAWPRRVLMTPRPMATWGPAEDILSGEGQPAHEPTFLLLPIQFDAWLAAGHWLRRGELMPLSDVFGAPSQWPALLAHDLNRWLSRATPSNQDMFALIGQLRDYLGPSAYTWLAASAGYPHLSADLTHYLALQLPTDEVATATQVPPQTSDGRTLAQRKPDAHLLEARLMAIAQLPWCRHGVMPDWLRSALLISLPAATQRQVREALYGLLKQSMDPSTTPGQGTAVSLGKVASGLAAADALPLGERLRRRLRLAGVSHAQPPDSPLRDVVYLSLLQGELPDLGLDAPEQFARAVRASGRAPISWNPLRWMAALGLTGWFVLLWYGWHGQRIWRQTVAQAERLTAAAKADPATTRPEAGARSEVAQPQGASQQASAGATASTTGTPATSPRPTAYISYRRSDAAIAQRLHAMLQGEFPGSIWMDIEMLKPGEDFMQVLEAALSAATVVLFIINKDTLSASRPQGDWLSREIENAVRREKRIVPVLVDGATLSMSDGVSPAFRDLVGFQAVALRTQQFTEDAAHIAALLRPLLAAGAGSRTPTASAVA